VLAVVVMALLLGFFDLLTLVEDLTLAFPLLIPVAVAPVVGVAPLVPLLHRWVCSQRLKFHPRASICRWTHG
jgi:hypothetical protein